jgi:chemotaxis-related protein WspB
MLVLMCEAAGDRFAVAARNVVEVIARPRLEPLAGKPDWFAGVFAYRGRVTPVIDLRRLVAAGSDSPRWSNRIVLVRAAESADPEQHVGLLVDRAAAEQLEDDATTAKAPRTSQILPWGPTRLDDRGMVCMLELANVLTPQRLATLFASPAA